MDALPAWLEELDENDLGFIRRFVLASGSLKEVAKVYGVSYPTVRLRLDRLIQKIGPAQEAEEPYIAVIRRMAVDGKIEINAARTLIAAYKKTKRTEE